MEKSRQTALRAVAVRIVSRKRPVGFRPKAYSEISTTKGARRRSMAQTELSEQGLPTGLGIRPVDRLSGLHCDLREENH